MAEVNETPMRNREAGASGIAVPCLTPSHQGRQDGTIKRLGLVPESSCFQPFDVLKRALGPAGEGNVWHHIVEQRAANIGQFGAEAIHNTQNVVVVSREVNQAIANYYSTIQSFTGGLTVKQWLGSQSWVQQFEYGKSIPNKAWYGQSIP